MCPHCRRGSRSRRRILDVVNRTRDVIDACVQLLDGFDEKGGNIAVRDAQHAVLIRRHGLRQDLLKLLCNDTDVFFVRCITDFGVGASAKMGDFIERRFDVSNVLFSTNVGERNDVPARKDVTDDVELVRGVALADAHRAEEDVEIAVDGHVRCSYIGRDEIVDEHDIVAHRCESRVHNQS